MVENATFHTFKKSGKWYATGRGFFPTFNPPIDRATSLACNRGVCPGLSTPGYDLYIVVVPDDGATPRLFV